MFMLIVLVLFYLVTISSTFNYESNILDPFWSVIHLSVPLAAVQAAGVLLPGAGRHPAHRGHGQEDLPSV